MKGRVLFFIRLKPGAEADFLKTYQTIRYQVAGGVPGHLLDQVCRSTTSPDEWLITSEWENLDDFFAWERSPQHRELVQPMKACWQEARSVKFTVVAETRAESSAGQESLPPFNRDSFVAGVQ